MIRRIIEFSIDKPLLNHFFLLFILLMSIFAYINIPKEIFPPVAKDQIVISGAYAGSSAEVLDKMVVRTIEDELKNVNTIDKVRSVIKNGSFTIHADIKPGSSNIAVLSDVKDIVATTKRDLPSDMNEPIAKLVEHAIPLVLIAVAADAPTSALIERAEELKSRLSSFKDLSDITLRGDSDEELVIRLDEAKIAAMGLDRVAVVAVLQGISSIFPVGSIEQRGAHLFISTYNGEKESVRLEETLLGIGERRVRLGDIAKVSFELGDESELSHYNGMRNISLNINKAKSGNAIELSKLIRSELKAFETRYPGYTFEIYTDTSVWIKNRLNTVFANIIFGLMLVFLSMLVFVNRGIALVVAMGIPLSFMIGLIVSDAIGESLNMLSLLGALIALGMLVDEAIVVAENIYRHLEEGHSRRDAAILGASEMFPAVLTATLTTVFAFLPLLIISGEMGTFIKILPIMISVLLISSLFEAFYFLPLHAHDFMRLRKETHATHAIWEHLYRWYDKTLHLLFARRMVALLGMTLSILGLTFVLMKQSKFQLFPDFDVTQVYVTGKVNINNELSDTEHHVSRIEKVLLERLGGEDVASVTSVIGMCLDNQNMAEIGENLFHIFIDLHERAPENFFERYLNPWLSIEYDADALIRKRTAKEIGDEVERLIEPVVTQGEERPFEELSVTVPGTGVVARDVEIALSGKSEAEVHEALLGLQEKLKAVTGVYGVANDADIGQKELKLRVNRYGEQLGLSEQSVGAQLRAYYLKGEYGKMFNDEGLVRIRLESSQRNRLDALKEMQLQLPSGSLVALHEVCDFVYEQAYVSLIKEEGKRIRTLYGSIDKELITSSEVMVQMQGAIDALRAEGFSVDIKGEERENAKNKREMSQAAVLAIILILITLVWLFDSLKQSLIVLSTTPLVLFGVYVGHLLMGLNLTMPGLIGIVGLIGVVVNDGLIMVSFIKRARDTEELMRLARTRLRPILLTSITTVLGLSTLIFFASGQAMILQPMAISLGFGIAWATLLNLVYVPLLFAAVYKIPRPSR
ncbi:MAG: efflux RND transporter permease subunit [Campylobacterales bacterium]|nr:efflux RND transporter permease subunit [Campylobacterales bacterium]